MKIKYIQFNLSSSDNIENRINEELKGWKIKKIYYIDIKDDRIIVIGEVNE